VEPVQAVQRPRQMLTICSIADSWRKGRALNASLQKAGNSFIRQLFRLNQPNSGLKE
jgi:hypothetical protein